MFTALDTNLCMKGFRAHFLNHVHVARDHGGILTKALARVLV